jgi:ankyrin repeat protein
MYQSEINDVFTGYLRGLRRKDFGEALKEIERIPESQRRDILRDAEKNRTNRSFALIEAARFGATALIAPLLEYGADLEGVDDNGNTPLLRALFNSHIATAEALISAGANVLAKNNRGTRAADCALQAKGGLDLARRLYGKDVPLQYTNQNATTTLHFAAMSGDVAAIEWVLSATAFSAIDQTDAGARPLDRCSTLAALTYLQATAPGALPCIAMKNGNTTLHLAAEYAEAQLLQHLLQHAAPLGFTAKSTGCLKNTPLHYAASTSRTDNAALLLEAGAKINARNNYNFAPLHWAAKSGQAGMIRLLAERGADLNVKTSTQFIINEFRTPLYLAVDQDHYDAAKALLEAGADPNVVCDTSCSTPLTEACLQDSLPLIELLLAHNASPNGIDRGDKDYHYFPLMWARSAAVVERLIAAGADVNARGSTHDSALHSLVGRVDGKTDPYDVERFTAAIRVLLAHGADPAARDMHGATPLAKAQHPAVTALLVAAKRAPSVAPLSAPESERQQKQDKYRGFVRTLAGLFTGKEIADPADANQSASELGAELFQMADDVQDNATFHSLLLIAEQASRADVCYQSPDDYDNNETTLYRVIESLDHSRYREEALDWDLVLKLVSVLLDKGANVNAVETLWQFTPSHRAAQATSSGYTKRRDLDGLLAIIERLLDGGADPAIEDENGSCPLDHAADKKLVARMAARGCPRGRCYAALMYACRTDGAKQVERLIALHPEGINSGDKDGVTALMWAAITDCHDVVECLLRAGADASKTRTKGFNVFGLAAEAMSLEATRTLLAHFTGEPTRIAELLNHCNDYGVTALGYALSSEPNRIEAAELRRRREALTLLMIEHGARLDVLDKEGVPMIDYAPTKKLRTQLEKAAKAAKAAKSAAK